MPLNSSGSRDRIRSNCSGKAGAFGPLAEVVPERLMRSRDATGIGDRPRAERFGIALGGYGPDGRERTHYPDLLLISSDGDRIAVELELTPKGRARRERILTCYAIDPRIEAVLYLAGRPAVREQPGAG